MFWSGRHVLFLAGIHQYHVTGDWPAVWFILSKWLATVWWNIRSYLDLPGLCGKLRGQCVLFRESTGFLSGTAPRHTWYDVTMLTRPVCLTASAGHVVAVRVVFVCEKWFVYVRAYMHARERGGEREKLREGETGVWAHVGHTANRQNTDRQIDKHKERQTNKYTFRQTDRKCTDFQSYKSAWFNTTPNQRCPPFLILICSSVFVFVSFVHARLRQVLRIHVKRSHRKYPHFGLSIHIYWNPSSDTTGCLMRTQTFIWCLLIHNVNNT